MCCNIKQRTPAMSGDFESDIDKNTIIMNTSISMENITIDIFIHV